MKPQLKIRLGRRNGGQGVSRLAARLLVLPLAIVLLLAAPALSDVGGSITGTVKDVTGAVLPGASVVVTQAETGLRHSAKADPSGVYSFPILPVGHYDVVVTAAGFAEHRRVGVIIEANSALVLDVALKLGSRSETVNVSENAVRVETASTQMGQLIGSVKIESVPLNGRSFTDLLALQPGVVPATTIVSSNIADVGASTFSPSGNLNPGTISVSGQREYSNGFMVNGAHVEEDVNMGAAIIPNLDSIDQFRILTNNFDAEYGNYSGGQINVVTKSGGNSLHGDFFEFLRNTQLDARNFYTARRGSFNQNQFGGTVGGPIVRNKVFFFLDYQGTRQIEGVDTGIVPVPSAQDRIGNLIDDSSLFIVTASSGSAALTLPQYRMGSQVHAGRELASTTTTATPTSVNGQNWASILSARLGYRVFPGEPYYTPGCVSSIRCVLPDAVLPMTAWSAPAQNLLQYIPLPNVGTTEFSTASYDQRLRDDKGSARVDFNTHSWGTLSGYYYVDDYTLNSPYPTAQGGASVPGFNAFNLGRAQLVALSDTRTFGTNAVNEFHFTYMRDANNLGKPTGGVGPSLASQGFLTGVGTPGIVPLAPQIEGVENIIFNNYTIGVPVTGLDQRNNTLQWSDNFLKVSGTHNLRFGGDFHDDQVNANPNVQFNGTFSFFGQESGIDFADFLLGIPSSFTQGDAQSFYNRSKYGGVFAQDSWRVRPRLTLNYGVRWDSVMPWYEKYNQVQTLVPGQQSTIFPGAPLGLVFPGDKGIPRTLAPTPKDDFAPRVGLAYSPSFERRPLKWLFGGTDQTSIHVGYGKFYTAIEGVEAGVMAANPPYGETYTSPAPPLFNQPFITAANGQFIGQPYPLTFPPLTSATNKPNSNINWSQYLPVTGVPGYLPGNRTPYAEEYMFSIQRQLGANTLLIASYAGSEDHHLLVLIEANPGNPALCLGVSQPGQVAPGTPTCGPFGESGTYTTFAGQTINGTRGPFGRNFGSNTYQAAAGNSNYNSLQLTLRHSYRRLEFLAGYTYSKSLDNSSSLADQVNPFDAGLTYAPSSFDMKHNFVVSYRYELPVDALFHHRNRATQGWIVTGITRLGTGFPVTLRNNSDRSLLGTQPDGVNDYGIDEPDYTPGALEINHNPRNGKSYFNTALFSLQALGTPGTADRRFFYGPGINNFDMALLKNLPFTDTKALQFRMEAFNLINHAQFYGAGGVNGLIGSPSFGQVVAAAPPRLFQVALKLTF